MAVLILFGKPWRIPCVIRVSTPTSSLMKRIVACRDAMPVRLRPSCKNLSKAAIQTRFLLCQLSLVCRLRHQRFNALVEGTSSTIHKAVVTADEVRASGLLKDRIVITYPEEESVNNDMAILQAAADDWKQKWEHWTQYCFEQHYAYVNPIMIVQVLNGSGSKLTDTDLDDCLRKIEERTRLQIRARSGSTYFWPDHLLPFK